jgi:hypothetical protein
LPSRIWWTGGLAPLGRKTGKGKTISVDHGKKLVNGVHSNPIHVRLSTLQVGKTEQVINRTFKSWGLRSILARS